MKEKVNKKKKTEDSIKALMVKYAAWQEKQEKNKCNDFEQYLAEEYEFLDFDGEF